MSSRSPKVSVILPFYNAGDFLSASLKSLCDQTFTDYEIILINDGSTDGCEVIAKEFARVDQRIRYFENENRGLIWTLNFGLSHCRGKYVARMDADDYSYPDRLRKQFCALENNDFDIVGCDYDVVDQHGSKKGHISVPKTHTDAIARLVYSVPFAHGSVMFRNATGIYYDPENYRNVEDHWLWVRMAQKGLRFGAVPETLFSYRIHAGSITARNMRHMIAASSKLGRVIMDSRLIDLVQLRERASAQKNSSFDYSYVFFCCGSIRDVRVSHLVKCALKFIKLKCYELMLNA